MLVDDLIAGESFLRLDVRIIKPTTRKIIIKKWLKQFLRFFIAEII